MKVNSFLLYRNLQFQWLVFMAIFMASQKICHLLWLPPLQNEPAEKLKYSRQKIENGIQSSQRIWNQWGVILF